jgi:hypothetical protein
MPRSNTLLRAHIQSMSSVYNAVCKDFDDIVANYCDNLEPHFRFLDDNARPHRARCMINRLQELEINHSPLPARSPVAHTRNLRGILPMLLDNLDKR